MRKRAGLLLMLLGLVLASLAAMLVLGMAQQAQQQAAQQIRQVYVVTVARDIPENTLITPDMLTLKAFPADFAPAGAVTAVEEAAGKYSATRLFKDSVLLRAQLSGSKRARDLASNIPPGKVAFWLPAPELLLSTGGLKPGDRVDVLLTVNLQDNSANAGANGTSTGNKWYSTQTTLQNVEVYAIGSVSDALESGASPASAEAAATATAQVAARAGGRSLAAGDKPAIILLVDHQDAVILKFVKDVDGVVDLVLRSADDAQLVRTDGMSPDALVDRFKFRVPAQAPPRP